MGEENEDSSKENNIILAMVMLKARASFNFEAFKKDLSDNYSYTITDVERSEGNAIVMNVEDEPVAVMSMPFPIPQKDIATAAGYAYNWMTAEEELKDHKGHILLSLMGKSDDTIQRFKMLTAVICSILRTHDAIGVYKGAQSLLIPAKHYLTEARKRGSDLPLNLWIYFGLVAIKEKNYGYTYGLKAFDKKEMEVSHSDKDLVAIRAFLYNMAYYVLDNNVEFEDGQTCGLSEDEIVTITVAKGQFIDGETFRLGY